MTDKLSNNSNEESPFDEERRNIFVRRYWYFDSIHEISAAYGISETNVSTILLRMRAQLRSELHKEGIEV